MAHLLFFVAMIAGCLFWAAASVALAARTERPWLRRLLVAAGVLLAPLALLPAVGVTAYLAFGLGWPTNWFAPALTAFLATAIGVAAILALALSVPLAGLAALTVRFTLVVFVIVNLALIWIKRRNETPPVGAFICPRWVPIAGLASSMGLLVVDLIA
jgi:hypothetical protein